MDPPWQPQDDTRAIIGVAPPQPLWHGTDIDWGAGALKPVLQPHWFAGAGPLAHESLMTGEEPIIELLGVFGSENSIPGAGAISGGAGAATIGAEVCG